MSKAAKPTDTPFVRALPRLLDERQLSVRQVATKAGVSPSHLSRVLREADYKSPSGELTRKVAEALDLPGDYFPEFRQALVIRRIREDPALLDRLYRRLRDSDTLGQPPRR